MLRSELTLELDLIQLMEANRVICWQQNCITIKV